MDTLAHAGVHDFLGLLFPSHKYASLLRPCLQLRVLYARWRENPGLLCGLLAQLFPGVQLPRPAAAAAGAGANAGAGAGTVGGLNSRGMPAPVGPQDWQVMEQMQEGLLVALEVLGVSDQALLAAFAAFRDMAPEVQRNFGVAYAQVRAGCWKQAGSGDALAMF